MTIISLAVGVTFVTVKGWATKQVERRMSEFAEAQASLLDGQFKQVAMVGESSADFVEQLEKPPIEDLYAMIRSNIRRHPLIYGGVIAYEYNAYDPDVRVFCPYVYRGPDALKNMAAGMQALSTDEETSQSIDFGAREPAVSASRHERITL